MSIDALDPNDPTVSVNEDSIPFFDGSAGGFTGLISSGSIESGEPRQVINISALENSGAIRGEGTPEFSSGAVQLSGADQTLINTADGIIETTYRFGVWSRGGQTLELENDGIIRGGDDALRIEQDAVVVNRGTIESLGTYNLHQLGPGATADGITAFANVTDGSAASRLGFELLNEESGVISGPRSGVFVSDYSSRIENDGTITGATSGIIAQLADSLTLINGGTITQSGNGPTGGSGSPYPLPRGAVESNVEKLTVDNSGSITAAEYGLVVYGNGDISNAAGASISGNQGSIIAYTEEMAQVRVSISYPSPGNVSLPFDAALYGDPFQQVPVLNLPEVAAETGQSYLLPQFEQRADGKYYPIPDSYPATYTRPDGSTATIDLTQGLILDSTGRPLTTFDTSSSRVEALGNGDYDDIVDNAGTLAGNVNLGVGDDILKNEGLIQGTVQLESGDDLYDGTGSTVGVTVDGGAGNDTLTGGSGNDRLEGGSGIDEVRFSGARAGYTITFNADSTLTITDIDPADGSDGTDTLLSIERIKFAEGEFTSGEGTEGDDEIDLSGPGGGTAIGGEGDDIYICDDPDDLPVERPGEGRDTVRASLDWTLGPSIEVLELVGTGNLRGTGNAGANILVGNAGNNTLDGAAGRDTLEGGSGNDTYFVDDPDDVVIEITGAVDGDSSVPGPARVVWDAATERWIEEPSNIGDVADALRSSASNYALPAGIENATLLDAAGCAGLAGGADGNRITGNAKANLLIGGAGNDTLSGSGGNDVAAFSGARSGYRVEKLADGRVRVTDTDPTNGDDGVDILSGIEALRFSDSIEGGLGKSITRGGSAANTLDLRATGGQIGAGGAGNDVYRVNSDSDAVVELAGAGRDRVDASVSWVLWDNVEDLRLTGTKALSGWGNDAGNRMQGNTAANTLKGYAGDDTLFGGAGADRLDGGDGADVLRGGKGNDALTGGAGADIFVFDAALTGNTDTVSDFVPGTDRLQLDNDVFQGLAAGPLAASSFAIGAGLKTAQDADDRVIYDTATGTLYYDADGSGSTASPVAFAVLTRAPAISVADFLIVD